MAKKRKNKGKNRKARKGGDVGVKATKWGRSGAEIERALRTELQNKQSNIYSIFSNDLVSNFFIPIFQFF